MEEPKKVDSQKQNEMLELEQVDDEQKKEAVEEKKEAVTKPLQASQTEPMKNVINKEDSKESDEKLQKSLQLALKIRNKENKLKDIKFTFMCGSDTADGISEELVAAGLVTPPNKDAVKKGIQLLVNSVPEETKVIFELDANPDGTPFEQTDKATLTGFAQVSVV